MNTTWIIIIRELKERISSTSFWLLAIFGPILLTLMVYLLFHFGDNHKPKWKVLIVDPAMIMHNRIMVQQSDQFQFDFLNSYLEVDDFLKGKRYQTYDGFLEVNEKVFTNKSAFFFYREKPSLKVEVKLHYLLEKRLEEVYVSELTKLSLEEYRKIKQPITLGFRNAYDPLNQKSNVNSWVGLTFGAMITFFIFVFGMTILRSVSIEKSNRIVEIILASVHPRQLMLAKVIGVGIAAILQLLVWMVIIGLGLFIFKEQFFHTVNEQAIMGNLSATSGWKSAFGVNGAVQYNQFVELVFNQINFSVMLFYLIIFLVLAYLFYGSFFAGLGAMMSSESDGQQYVILILAVLFFSLLAGYLSIIFPESNLILWLSFIPFTSPVVCMVKIAQGYPANEFYQLIFSILILLISVYVMLVISGKIYRRGILRYNRKLHFKDFFKK